MATQQGVLVKQQTDINELPMDVIGYYFHVINQHSVSLQSQITDNWLENNTVIGDHIANSPTVVTLSGVFGELVYVPDLDNTNRLLQDARQATTPTTFQKLGKLTSLYPPIDNFTQKYINAENYIQASVTRYAGAVKQFFNTNRPEYFTPASANYESKIRQIYSRFESMRLQKLPFEVDTPYKTFKDMYIQSLTLRQGNQLYTTDIEVTLKQVYFLETQTTNADEKVLSNISAVQRAEVEKHGKTQGIGSNNSILYDMFGNGSAYYTYKR